ncbi:MAG: MBL fold metallo-hydrolase [Spirochaetia bacterium]|nr:MBL fold metallo-hydrolase [Spirochaetia bacterium]
MKVFTIFQPYEFTNTYLIGKKNCHEAILIDPGRFDITLLDLIESNHFYISHIFLTHSHINHTKGIPTLLKIYDAKIHSMKNVIHGIKTVQITGESEIHAGGFKITAIPISGHTDDSVIFKIGNMLFTGDTIKAGYTGETEGLKQQKEMTGLIRKKFFSLKSDYLIFPGHGSPSTLAAEKKTNLLLQK